MDVKDGYGMIHASKQHGSDLREPNEAAPKVGAQKARNSSWLEGSRVHVQLWRFQFGSQIQLSLSNPSVLALHPSYKEIKSAAYCRLNIPSTFIGTTCTGHEINRRNSARSGIMIRSGSEDP